MIYESYPWKRDLMRRKNLIIQYNTAKKLNQDYEKKAYTVLEKSIFYSAFIIRKLIDCKIKTSSRVDNYTLNVKRFSTLKTLNLIKSWPDEQSHDWEKPVKETVNGRDICNWLIHSFVFELCYVKGKEVVEGFLVTSELLRNDSIYYISLSDWLSYIDCVAKDSVVGMRIEVPLNEKSRIKSPKDKFSIDDAPRIENEWKEKKL